MSGSLVFDVHSSVLGTARENDPKDSYLSKGAHCLKSRRALRLLGQQHMLLHMHKMPGLDILFSLVCFLVSIQALELACFHTWGSQKVCRSVLDTREGAGDGWQGKWCFQSPKGNYLCNQNVTHWSSGWNNRPEHWELSPAEGMVLLQQVLRWWVEFLKQM